MLEKALQDCQGDLSTESLTQLQKSAKNIGDVFLEHYQTQKDTSHKQYPEAIKKFATSLHMKSAKAYRYVRNIFKVNFDLDGLLTKKYNATMAGNLAERSKTMLPWEETLLQWEESML